MTIDQPTLLPETETSNAQDLSSLSYSDYEKVRRGGAMPKTEAKAAPAPEAAQKQDKESAPLETEAKEDVQDTEVDSEESDDATDAKDEKPKKKSGFQRRIDRLNRDKAAALAEVEHWKQQALKGAGESKGDMKAQAAQGTQATTEGKPDPDKFDTHAEYVEALADWKIEQREKTREAEAQRKSQESKQQDVLKAHFDRVKTFAEKNDDFDDVLAAADDIQAPAHVQQAIVESDHGPALMYELAKNKAELARICALSPIAAAREIGKIESKLSQASEDKKTEPKITKAPKPLTTVGKGQSTTPKSIDDPNLSFTDYVRIRREQETRRRR